MISPNAKFPQPSRTGGQLHRPNKSLITANNKLYNSFTPGNIEEQLAFEIQREKNKISRFLLIKEN